MESHLFYGWVDHEGAVRAKVAREAVAESVNALAALHPIVAHTLRGPQGVDSGPEGVDSVSEDVKSTPRCEFSAAGYEFSTR
jgi:hypothetical protein